MRRANKDADFATGDPASDEISADKETANSEPLSINHKLFLLGEILYLLSHSDEHRRYTVEEIERLIIPAVRLGQFRLYRTKARPVGLVTWALLNDAASEAFGAGVRTLNPAELNCGPHLWVLDFVVPFGHARRIARDLADNIFVNASSARSVRRKPDGSVERVLRFPRTRAPAVASG